MRTITLFVAVSAALLSGTAQAQMPMPGAPTAPGGMQMPAQMPAQMPVQQMPAQMPMQMEMALPPGPNGTATGVKGEITRLDIPNGRVAIRHEPIANLNMNGMNMVFRLAQPSLADGLKVGDKVVFEAERKDGVITLTKVTKAAN